MTSSSLVTASLVIWALAATVQIGSLILAALSVREIRRSQDGQRARMAAVTALGSRAPLLSAILPAHNESAGIVHAVESLLASTYPNLEVVVVDDGSTDDMLARLISTYRLLPLPPPVEAANSPAHGIIWALWRSPREPSLVVVQKQSRGTKSDAANAGLAMARGELVLVADADGLPDSDALLSISSALLVSPTAVVAAGGTILPVNATRVRLGEVVDRRVPRTFLGRIQTVEYLRSFLLSRPGLARLRALPLISGAFGVFWTDLVRDAGGFSPTSLGEDMDITVTLVVDGCRRMGAAHVIQVPEAVLWTEVPESLRILSRQRRRWAKGLAQVLRGNMRVLLNPRRGGIGLIGLPWMVLSEWLSPFIQLAGITVTILILVAGLLPPSWLVALLVMTIVCTLGISTMSVWAEQRFLGVFRERGGVWRLIGAAAVEPFAYHPLTAWWKLRGTFGRGQTWGAMPRKGLQSQP